MTTQEKIKEFVEEQKNYLEKVEKINISTAFGFNWDSDIWNHRQTIIDYFRREGYNVEVITKWEVTDIIITKKITL